MKISDHSRWRWAHFQPGGRRNWIALGVLWGLAMVSGFIVVQDFSLLPSAILAFGLAWVAVVDADRMIVPDAISLPLGLFGVILAGLGAIETTVLMSLMGGLIGYGVLALISASYRWRTGRAGLGLGDAKLLAIGGIWLGPLAIPFVTVIASFGGLLFVVCRQLIRSTEPPSQALPFGPHLALSIWIIWILQSHFERLLTI